MDISTSPPLHPTQRSLPALDVNNLTHINLLTEAAYPSPMSDTSGTTAVEEASPKDSSPFPAKARSYSQHLSNPLPKIQRLPVRSITTGTYKVRGPNYGGDRFIPIRRSPSSLTRRYQMSKPLHKLSSFEKLCRQRGYKPDPFSPATPSTVLESQRATRPRLIPRSPRSVRDLLGDDTGILGIRRESESQRNRQVSAGGVWNVGGTAAATGGPTTAVPDGRGGLLGSGTTAPMYSSHFFDSNTPDQDLADHEGRIALALGIDPTDRILEFHKPYEAVRPYMGWHVLDAPNMRDDFYCSLLAYCASTHSLAVGLNDKVYIWSESRGVEPLLTRDGHWPSTSYLSCLGFSSAEGGQSILAIGRANGTVTLWSLHEDLPRFEVQQPCAVACLAWKNKRTTRVSKRPWPTPIMVKVEELLVGDEVGNVYYYAVEWVRNEGQEMMFQGAQTLLARIQVHTQQICGIAWSHDGTYFATGGNDNLCCLFETSSIIGPRSGMHPYHTYRTVREAVVENGRYGPVSTRSERLPVGNPASETRSIGVGREKHRWQHGAAVKAIAFCPWQKSLIATGGGSNDRCIHFYHTVSGACLATINVAAQVTSLIWSTTRREIAATFGYSQPDHPYRIAVFSWPECRQVVAIPWVGELRALYAISYPRGPSETNPVAKNGDGDVWTQRTVQEGCIVVAASDESVKFHEVWAESDGTGVGGGSSGGSKGILGGSDILEGLEGIDHDGMEVIR
ncbi:MAG: hypothetical protein M1817_002572 [Caeruleum heppii]|nr:MAG: hypothetical protein M1817_002572 [Caeruleum heppii]